MKRLLLFLLALFSTAAAQPLHVEGTVTGVNASQKLVQVSTAAGPRRVWVGPNTTVIINGAKAGITSLAAGEHVSVDGVESGGVLYATEVISYGQANATFYNQKPQSAQETYNSDPSVQPSPNSIVYTKRPTIVATFSQNIKKAQIWIDGKDFTPQVVTKGNTATLTPDYDLDTLTHTVRAVGHSSGPFTVREPVEWRFTIARDSGSAPVAPTVLMPAANSTVSSRRPTIGAVFPQNITNARLLVDGADFTDRLQIWGNRANWTPNYDLASAVHLVVMSANGPNGQVYQNTWNFQVPNWDQPGPGQVYHPAAYLKDFTPPPGNVLTIPRPVVACKFSQRVQKKTIRMVVDGHDVTPSCNLQASSASWTPAYNLDFGQHHVRVTATDENGQAVNGDWTFTIAR